MAKAPPTFPPKRRSVESSTSAPGGYPSRRSLSSPTSAKANAKGSPKAAGGPAVRSGSPDPCGAGSALGRAPRPRMNTTGSTGSGTRGRTDAIRPKADGARARSPDGNRGKMSEQEVMALWRMLDRRNQGEVKVVDIVQNASALQRRCPELLEKYDKVVRGGKLTLNDLKRFYGLSTNIAQKGLRTNGQNADKTSTGDAFKELTLEEIRCMWAHVDPQSVGKIGLPELMSNAAFLQTSCPEIISNFEEIDRDGDMHICFEDVAVFFNTEVWLQEELRKVVGLQGLKEQLMRFHRSIVLDRRRAADGFDVSTGGKLHMIFRGNPGTGKTSMGRIMAKLLHRIGVIPKKSFREVQRPDLVAEYVGQTGPRTRKVIEEAKTGVLFIDEAYRLSSGGKNDFGKEAIEELMGSMNDPPGKAPVQIYAGYPGDMDQWMKANEGLYRRIAYTFDFQDYSLLELAEILSFYSEQKGFMLEASFHGETGKARLGSLLGMHTMPRTRQLMNGGLCERIFETAKQCLDARDDPARPSVTIIEADIVSACKRIPAPPDPTVTSAQAPENVSIPVAARPLDVATTAPAGGVQRLLVLRLHTGSITDSRSMAFVAGVVNPMSPYVIVSFGGSVGEGLRQAWKSFKDKGGHLEPSWEETVVLPLLPQEHLLQIAVYDRRPHLGDLFLGGAQLALSAVPQMGFNGELELRKSDSRIGTLSLELYWQTGTGPAGQALDCVLFGSHAAATPGFKQQDVVRPAAKSVSKAPSKALSKAPPKAVSKRTSRFACS